MLAWFLVLDTYFSSASFLRLLVVFLALPPREFYHNFRLCQDLFIFQEALIKNINESLGFGEIKSKIADKFRELSDNDDLIMSFFDDYITETNLITKYSFLKQKEYALVLLKHLCSPKAKENLGFLICYAGIFLTTRLDTSYKTGKIADWELDMYKYLNLLLKCQSKKDFYSIYDNLIKYKLNPPWVQEKNTSMLVKIISEIAYEACGVLIRFPYFKVLKDNIQNRKNHLTTAST